MKWYYELLLIIVGVVFFCLLIEYILPILIFIAVFPRWLGSALFGKK